MSLTVFIPTAGTGSRLEKFTKIYNKSLLPYQNKPIISHIIESFDTNTEFVVALGHKGNLVKQYLKICYPYKKIKFIKIDNFNKKGSGLGYTLFKSRKFLQKSFLFCPCDGIFKKIDGSTGTIPKEYLQEFRMDANNPVFKQALKGMLSNPDANNPENDPVNTSPGLTGRS